MTVADPAAPADTVAHRARVLRDLGAGPAEVEELLAYNRNRFRLEGDAVPPLPLADEPFVEAWEGYTAEAGERGVFAVLRERLVQLRFPVAAGVSTSAAYGAATRRGVLPPADAPGTVLERPGELRLRLHPTPAGRVPVLVAEHRPDFETLVRALARRNEPEAIPPSQGACVVGGLVNWDRVARLRERFERGELDADGAADWSAAFAWVRERRELYQDRVVLLSTGPYSGVPAAEMGMDGGEWRRTSLAIRLEHECAHYFTRRVLGSMQNALLDELIADYAGIAAAAGRFRADWFLRFLGLEGAEGFREGRRLANYRGRPPLSDGAFAVLQRLVRRVAVVVERVDAEGEGGGGAEHRTRMMLALARLCPEELVGEEGAGRLRVVLTKVP